MTIRAKMCQNKVSFRTKGKAQAAGEKFGQRVYECPICFCWHCTNKENWKEEFVTVEECKKRMSTLENELRREFNEKLHEKNSRISKLQCENKRLRMGHDD